MVSCNLDAYDSIMSMSPSVRDEIKSHDNSVSLEEPPNMDRPDGTAFFSSDARRESLLLGPNIEKVKRSFVTFHSDISWKVMERKGYHINVLKGCMYSMITFTSHWLHWTEGRGIEEIGVDSLSVSDAWCNALQCDMNDIRGMHVM